MYPPAHWNTYMSQDHHRFLFRVVKIFYSSAVKSPKLSHGMKWNQFKSKSRKVQWRWYEMKRINCRYVLYPKWWQTHTLPASKWRGDCCYFLSDPLIHSAVHKYYLMQTPNQWNSIDRRRIPQLLLRWITRIFFIFLLLQITASFGNEMWIVFLCDEDDLHRRIYVQCVGWTEETKLGQRKTRHSNPFTVANHYSKCTK